MVITCVTSRYLPNLRYIARLFEVDHAVVLDLSPLPHQNKNSFISRNRIYSRSSGLLWLSVPTRRKGVQYISNARIDTTQHNWIKKHINSIAQAYPNHKNVAGDFLERLVEVLLASDGSLIDVNMRSLRLILKTLRLNDAQLLMQSSIVQQHSKEHRLDIAKLVGATDYVAGRVEWAVLDKAGCKEKMELSGVRVHASPELNDAIFPVEMIEKLSCLHSMLTFGPEKTRNIIYKMVHFLRHQIGVDKLIQYTESWSGDSRALISDKSSPK